MSDNYFQSGAYSFLYPSELIMTIVISIFILIIGYELVKYIRANRKYATYVEAFKTSLLMKLAKDRELPIEEYLYVEKEYKGVERMIKERMIELLDEVMKEKEKKADKSAS